MTAPCPAFQFPVEIDVTAARPREVEQLLDDFRALLRARGLEHSGRTSGGRWSLLVRSEASQVTDADRRAVRAWAVSRADVASIRVGELVDARD